MKVTVDIALTVEQLAEIFCGLDDDTQARFFVECAKIASSWEPHIDQFYAVGRHLRTCSCSTEAARELVRRIAAGIVP
jgi:hypothetical protein